MKTLKNESTTYVDQIVSAIESCYTKNAEPTNIQFTALYSFIGECICQQGEKAFVAHLAKLLAEQLPQLGGFSMRNLRRMRDFYRTYENQPELLHKAQAFGWTQNAVILDCCDTDAQRSFYIELAIKGGLSKLALMRAITAEIFEAATQETAVEECDHCRPVVGIAIQEEAVDTTAIVKTPCGAFVPHGEPLHQGDDLPLQHERHKTADYNNVFENAVTPTHMASLKYPKSLIAAIQKVAEIFPKMRVYLNQAERWELLFERPPKWPPPPLMTLA